MDASASGNPCYPPECIVILSWDGVVAAFMQIIGRCLKSVVILFFGVSGDVGCLHMSIGLKIGSLLGRP